MSTTLVSIPSPPADYEVRDTRTEDGKGYVEFTPKVWARTPNVTLGTRDVVVYADEKPGIDLGDKEYVIRQQWTANMGGCGTMGPSEISDFAVFTGYLAGVMEELQDAERAEQPQNVIEAFAAAGKAI